MQINSPHSPEPPALVEDHGELVFPINFKAA